MSWLSDIVRNPGKLLSFDPDPYGWFGGDDDAPPENPLLTEAMQTLNNYRFMAPKQLVHSRWKAKLYARP